MPPLALLCPLIYKRGMIKPATLRTLATRFAAIDAEMAGNPPIERLIALGKERAEIEPLAMKAQRLEAIAAELADVQELLADPDFKDIAYADQQKLLEEQALETQELRLLLLPKDSADERSAIIEVRGGTGGDEAAIFAGNLFEMYTRYAANKKWKVEILNESEGAMGGYKEIVASISGSGVFARLKFESGVHRVQRVPDTETQGRVHTSAATVAVLPEAEEIDYVIEEKDLKIDTFRAGGAGGQHVNKTDSAVRITHLPTGVVVVQQDERSQHKNKAAAMKILRSRLYEAQRERIANERAADRKGQVGSGDRSERIRTYNFPQGRVSDHRINLTLYKIDEMMQGLGAVDEMIDALITNHQAQLLEIHNGDEA